jgi:DNA-binding transcriptional MerR regulator
MTRADTQNYSIGEVADAVGMSTHALRFYEREQLLIRPVRRTVGGSRQYSKADIDWLRICVRLRESGMPLSELKRFADLVRQGPGNEAERLALLDSQRVRVDEQIRVLEQARAIIAWKTEVYGRHLRTRNVTGLWDPTVAAST